MLSIPFLLQLFGCPTPPDPNQANAPAGNQPNQPNQPNGQNNPPPGDGNTPKAPGKVEGAEGGPGGGSAPPPGQPGMGGLPPIDGNVIQESVIVHIVNESPEEAPVRFTQEQVSEEDHVKLSGNIDCSGDGCDSQMILRVLPFISPDADEERDIEFDSYVTTKIISSLGAYDILLPKSDTPVVFELLVDINEDGLSSKGDRMAVLEKGGQLIPNADLNGLNLNTTDQEEIGPLGGPVAPQQNPMEEPPPEEGQGPENERPEGEGPGPDGEGPGPEGEGPGPDGEGPGPEGNPPPPEGGEPQ